MNSNGLLNGIRGGDRKRANGDINNLLKEFPEKSILQILPLLVKSCNWNAVRVAVARIERNQADKLRSEDCCYLREVKELLSNN